MFGFFWPSSFENGSSNPFASVMFRHDSAPKVVFVGVCFHFSCFVGHAEVRTYSAGKSAGAQVAIWMTWAKDQH